MLAQIHESDVQLEKAIESYNYANVQLDQIDADLNSNAHHLVVAQKSLKSAQAHIAERLRALYVNGDGGGAVEILLGAENLDDLLGRLDMVQRVGDQDAKVLGDVKAVPQGGQAASRALEDGARATRPRSWPSARARSSRSRASSPSASRCSPGSRARSSSCRPRRRAGRRSSQRRGRGPARRAAARRLDGPRGSGGAQPPAASPPRSTRQHPSDLPDPRRAPVAVRRRRRARDAGARQAVRLGRRRARAPSTAPGSSRTSTPRSASRCRTTPPPSTATARPSRTTTCSPATSSSSAGLGHVGIYIGGGQFIHAPHTGDVVKISSLSDARRLRRRPPPLAALAPRAQPHGASRYDVA